MDVLLSIPFVWRLAMLFIAGACAGSIVNWGVYTLAWSPRQISPWSPAPPTASARPSWARLPIFGWLGLRGESSIHGRWFWLRPMLLEFSLGCALAALYWWEVGQQGLLAGQTLFTPVLGAQPMPLSGWLPTFQANTVVLHASFLVHSLLLFWMLVASFIDIDEKLIPDEVTVTGTLLGLCLATLLPMSLLPHVNQSLNALRSNCSTAILDANHLPANGPIGNPLTVEPVTVATPQAWPTQLNAKPNWRSLALGLSCYFLWCFALTPRIWRGRHGFVRAMRVISARVARELCRPPIAVLLAIGVPAILMVWLWGGVAWVGLLTSLVGLVGGGAIVWAVRIVGSAALRREAMGFGDVTLMMMIGTFLGWQACWVLFFLAPFCAVGIAIGQLVLRREDEIPFGPFLCMAAAFVVVCWAPVWNRVEAAFAIGGLVPMAMVVCMVLLGVLLGIWQAIKTALFSRSE